MKKNIENNIKLKIAIALNRLLEIRRNNEKSTNDIAESFNKIAINADIRKATVSDTFNAITLPSTATLILILDAMQFDLCIFSEHYKSITEKDIYQFSNRSKNS
ncbi:hypothetical protein LX95_01050 [Mesonia algae]|uniref:HTH cro/C1-type domain-containing protein n=1 Tax=Mesonia algae TaxID=213248 RepID=A0A2W7IVL7_9FLAO|nr:hypothetical protein [Mesonia algae]PZW42733.1 hypothetical protein LX95_01050 [Mesonia algae]